MNDNISVRQSLDQSAINKMGKNDNLIYYFNKILEYYDSAQNYEEFESFNNAKKFYSNCGAMNESILNDKTNDSELLLFHNDLKEIFLQKQSIMKVLSEIKGETKEEKKNENEKKEDVNDVATSKVSETILKEKETNKDKIDKLIQKCGDMNISEKIDTNLYVKNKQFGGESFLEIDEIKNDINLEKTSSGQSLNAKTEDDDVLKSLKDQTIILGCQLSQYFDTEKHLLERKKELNEKLEKYKKEYEDNRAIASKEKSTYSSIVKSKIKKK